MQTRKRPHSVKSDLKLTAKAASKLASSLRERREEMGISQATLAELVDVSVTHIGHLEQGRRAPSLMMLVRIANVLEMDLELVPRS